MKTSRKTALILAGAAVSALLLAPVADARPTSPISPTCQQTDVTSICDVDDSAPFTARPVTTAPQANKSVIPWLGAPGSN